MYPVPSWSRSAPCACFYHFGMTLSVSGRCPCTCSKNQGHGVSSVLTVLEERTSPENTLKKLLLLQREHFDDYFCVIRDSCQGKTDDPKYMRIIKIKSSFCHFWGNEPCFYLRSEWRGNNNGTRRQSCTCSKHIQIWAMSVPSCRGGVSCFQT